MTGQHRGGRSLRRRLIVAVLAASVGRGYVGRHRLADAVLGVRHDPVLVSEPTAAPAAELPAAALLAAVPTQAAPTPAPVLSPVLSVVPVPRSVDPLMDTVPHPVVRLFPLPVAAPVDVPSQPGAHESAEDAVFSAIEADLTGGAVAVGSRRGIA